MDNKYKTVTFTMSKDQIIPIWIKVWKDILHKAIAEKEIIYLDLNDESLRRTGKTTALVELGNQLDLPVLTSSRYRGEGIITIDEYKKHIDKYPKSVLVTEDFNVESLRGLHYKGKKVEIVGGFQCR